MRRGVVDVAIHGTGPARSSAWRLTTDRSHRKGLQIRLTVGGEPPAVADRIGSGLARAPAWPRVSASSVALRQSPGRHRRPGGPSTRPRTVDSAKHPAALLVGQPQPARQGVDDCRGRSQRRRPTAGPARARAATRISGRPPIGVTSDGVPDGQRFDDREPEPLERGGRHHVQIGGAVDERQPLVGHVAEERDGGRRGRDRARAVAAPAAVARYRRRYRWTSRCRAATTGMASIRRSTPVRRTRRRTETMRPAVARPSQEPRGRRRGSARGVKAGRSALPGTTRICARRDAVVAGRQRGKRLRQHDEPIGRAIDAALDAPLQQRRTGGRRLPGATRPPTARGSARRAVPAVSQRRRGRGVEGEVGGQHIDAAGRGPRLDGPARVQPARPGAVADRSEARQGAAAGRSRPAGPANSASRSTPWPAGSGRDRRTRGRRRRRARTARHIRSGVRASSAPHAGRRLGDDRHRPRARRERTRSRAAAQSRDRGWPGRRSSTGRRRSGRR